ncbi:class I SAM-dependent methyltransferase [Nanoarchaeota archaeon]
MVSVGVNYNQTKAFAYLAKVSDEKVLQVKEIKKVIKKLKHSNTYLDVGAGAGDIFFGLAKHFKQATGLEPGDRMFEILEKKVKKDRLRNTNLVHDQWQNFYRKAKKNNQKYDLITNIQTIYFFKDRRKAIKDMLSLLNKDGRLVLIHNYGKDAKDHFIAKFRHEFLNKPMPSDRTSAMVKRNFKKRESYIMDSKFYLQDFKDLEKDHLSKKSMATNYYLKFALKKWYDEFTKDQKARMINYLEKRRKGNKYILSERYWVHILRK